MEGSLGMGEWCNGMSNSYFDFNTIEDLYNDVEKVYLNDLRPWVIGYSGGKDSSAVVEVVLRMLLRLPKEKRQKHIYIVSSDTLIENPIVLDSLKKNIMLINKAAKMQQLPVSAHMVYPEPGDSYWANIIGKGYVTPKSIQYRWCTERLKIRPSNAFIKQKLEHDDVVVVLGVRKDESVARKARIEKSEIDGYVLKPHGSLKGKNTIAYTYAPIVELTTNDVWEILYFNNDRITAWGSDTQELFDMYLDGSSGSGECPFIADGSSSKSTCANSRFGCWICTVVKEDRSLNGFINSGKEQLIPLRDFRQWILSIRDLPENRMQHKRNGKVVIKEGKVMQGPFNFEARQKVLKKLLETQNKMRAFYPDIELITEDELKAIQNIWDMEVDLSGRRLLEIYKEVTGETLPWDNYSTGVFEEDVLDIIDSKVEEHGVSKELFTSLLLTTNKYKHFNNKSYLNKAVSKLMNQEYLHQDIINGLDDEIEKSEVEY